MTKEQQVLAAIGGLAAACGVTVWVWKKLKKKKDGKGEIEDSPIVSCDKPKSQKRELTFVEEVYEDLIENSELTYEEGRDFLTPDLDTNSDSEEWKPTIHMIQRSLKKFDVIDILFEIPKGVYIDTLRDLPGAKGPSIAEYVTAFKGSNKTGKLGEIQEKVNEIAGYFKIKPEVELVDYYLISAINHMGKEISLLRRRDKAKEVGPEKYDYETIQERAKQVYLNVLLGDNEFDFSTLFGIRDLTSLSLNDVLLTFRVSFKIWDDNRCADGVTKEFLNKFLSWIYKEFAVKGNKKNQVITYKKLVAYLPEKWNQDLFVLEPDQYGRAKRIPLLYGVDD